MENFAFLLITYLNSPQRRGFDLLHICMYVRNVQV